MFCGAFFSAIPCCCVVSRELDERTTETVVVNSCFDIAAESYPVPLIFIKSARCFGFSHKILVIMKSFVSSRGKGGFYQPCFSRCVFATNSSARAWFVCASVAVEGTAYCEHPLFISCV